jgi:hypothetical protein
MSGSVHIRGIQEAQRGNAQLMASFKPGGKFAKAVWKVTVSLHRYAVGITHVWRIKGGSLKASHRMKMLPDGLTGYIYIDPSSVNPRNRQRPAQYGYYEEKRGGAHAFYRRTVEEHFMQASAMAVKGLYT